VRYDPIEGQTVCDTGVVREIISQVDVFKKIGVPDSSAFGVQILGPLTRDEFGQVTLHTGDLAHEDAKSYTCFVSRGFLQSSGIIRGDVVSFQLCALSIPGRRVVWLCERLESPFV